MTEPAAGAAGAAALRPPFGPEESARRVRARGGLYFAEHQLRKLRAYGGTLLGVGVGTPVLYLDYIEDSGRSACRTCSSWPRRCSSPRR